MAARRSDAGRDGLAVSGARPAPGPEMRAGVRRRYRGIRCRSSRRRSRAARRIDDGQFLQTVQQSGVKVRILGCGTSTGVPKIGNEWGQCDPDEPRNNRLRTSIMVESGGERVLVDYGPDLRQQLLAATVSRLEGVIVTHAHGDHCHGIDELRPVSQAIGGPVPLHARGHVLRELKERFGYAFAESDFYRPIVEARELGEELRFGDARLRFVDQPHGGPTSLGLRLTRSAGRSPTPSTSAT